MRRYDAIKPHLTERQRRIWLGSEARELGSGGVGIVADAVAVSPDTVRRGRTELDDPQPLPVGRSRGRGGGRKRAEEHDPGLLAALDELVEPETRGDPMSRLRWTTKSPATWPTSWPPGPPGRSRHGGAAAARGTGTACRATPRPSRARQHPDRDAQFRYINDQVSAALAAGSRWSASIRRRRSWSASTTTAAASTSPPGDPVRVERPRLPRRGRQGGALRRLRPGREHRLGVGGHRRRHRRVRGGDDPPLVAHHRPARLPRRRPAADHRGRGGSNGYRLRPWKTELAALAAETGLPITVCHLPPGTSQVESR